MSSKPNQTRGAKHANHYFKSFCKRAAKRLRRRLEKLLLDDWRGLIGKFISTE